MSEDVICLVYYWKTEKWVESILGIYCLQLRDLSVSQHCLPNPQVWNNSPGAAANGYVHSFNMIIRRTKLETVMSVIFTSAATDVTCPPELCSFLRHEADVLRCLLLFRSVVQNSKILYLQDYMTKGTTFWHWKNQEMSVLPETWQTIFYKNSCQFVFC